MGVFYLGFGILASALVFIECRRRQLSLWWAGLTLVFPLAAPFVFKKTRPQKWIIPAAAIGGCFVLVLGLETFFHVSQTRKSAVSIPPVIKKIIELNQSVKETTIEIYTISGRLNSLSFVQSRISDIRSTIDTIERIRTLENLNQEAIQRLLEFTSDHRKFLVRQQLGWVLAIRKFYSDRRIKQHHDSLLNYLSAFERLLIYTRDNFDNIMELQSTRHMKNYDAYYMLYRQAADTHNRFNRKRIAFQNQFMEDYPEVKPFLPGPHHLEPFKFWDKFNF